MRRYLACACAVALAAVALSACGKTSSASSSPSSSTASSSASAGAATTSASASAASGCGTTPTLPFHDQSGVISALGPAYTSQYNGFPTPIFKSAFANFKPKGSPPYTIGIAVTQPISAFQAAIIPMLQKELHAVKGVGKVILLTSPPSAITTQVQQANSLIQQHVTILITEPTVPQSFIPVDARAAAAGIPVIGIINGPSTPDTINIEPNSVADAAVTGAVLAKAIDGRGTILGVHAIRSTGVDQSEFAGWKAAFAKCPQIKLDDSIEGDFQPSVAKAQTLSYLSSHPQPLAGVVETATMGQGIIQAFQQAGRPLPKMVDAGSGVGDLVYFKTQPDKLISGFTVPPNSEAAAIKYTVTQLLAGHGPKISEIAHLSMQVNPSNLSQFIPAGASANSQAAVLGPWMPPSYMAPLFNK
jgi:ABC-type sugar transport system substrate-binding protein